MQKELVSTVAKAGADRYRVGEHLWVADPPGVAEVIVRKSTGQLPYPEFLNVEFVDGRKYDQVDPSDLFRSRQTAFLLAQAYQQFYTIRSSSALTPHKLRKAAMELYNAQAAAAIGHPYRPTYELTWSHRSTRWIKRTFLPPGLKPKV